ncbi:MAG: polyhydroxyalkanoic acid system family protein [Alphaproteobacteria bacterium]|nr:polyhydroxyalkanoic acid system family protein [Alphaproteobacteria bacterium]
MLTPSEPITVTVSHRLGRAEARRRIDNGLGSIRAEVAPLVRSLDYGWNGDRLDFRASVMMQTISGAIEVHDDHVRIEFNLPRLLHMVAKRVVGRIQQQGAALLEDKSTRK